MTEKVLLAKIPSNPDLTMYCAYLGVGHPIHICGVIHECDGYSDTSTLKIKSVERREYPEPCLIRGTLDLDLNRPGEDAGSNHWPHEVVIEVHSYPRTLVYAADGYRLEARVIKSELGYSPEVNGYKFSATVVGAVGPYAKKKELQCILGMMADRFRISKEAILIIEEE